jgi:hypothetical protein
MSWIRNTAFEPLNLPCHYRVNWLLMFTKVVFSRGFLLGRRHRIVAVFNKFFPTLPAVKREPVNDAGLCNTGVGKNFFYFTVIRYQVLLWLLVVLGIRDIWYSV